MAARQSTGNWFDASFSSDLDVSACFFDGIDWQKPWLVPFLPVAMPIVTAGPDWRQALNAAARDVDLRNQRDIPIQFVAQSELSSDVAYEAFIGATGRVPTRDNIHDFFNALVWLTFPKAKAQLNALQAIEIERAAMQGPDAGPLNRGKLRDAATIFDENAAVLVTCNLDLVAALRAHQWNEVFIARRVEFERDCEVYLFGHALMEKLVSPFKAITAHAWVVEPDEVFFSLVPQEKRLWIDAAVAKQMAERLDPGQFTPLPVLGVPGWAQLQDADFYADRNVFRPVRGAKAPAR